MGASSVVHEHLDKCYGDLLALGSDLNSLLGAGERLFVPWKSSHLGRISESQWRKWTVAAYLNKKNRSVQLSLVVPEFIQSRGLLPRKQSATFLFQLPECNGPEKWTEWQDRDRRTNHAILACTFIHQLGTSDTVLNDLSRPLNVIKIDEWSTCVYLTA